MLAQRSWKPLLVGAVAAGILAPGTAAHAAPSASQIEQQIRSESTRLEKVVEQYNRIGEELKVSQGTVASVRRKLNRINGQVAAADERVGRMAAEAYKGASLAEFSAVVGAPDTATAVARLVTIGQVARYEDQQMDVMLGAKARQDVQVARLDALIADQQAKRKALADQKRSINADLAKLYALRRSLYGTSSTSSAGSGKGTPPPYVAGRAGTAVRFAYAQLGKPYAWGAAGPGSYDCSGLTMSAWRAAGVSLSHNAAMQWNEVAHIGRGSLQPGDLVFYSGLGHVGLYVGNGKIIHAPTFGDVVRIAAVDIMTPYGYGRPR